MDERRNKERKPQPDFFSWENLQEIADLAGNIEFIDGILKKYPWSDSQKNGLKRKLAALNEKQQDQYLNLSVIGEFSSGKSTFINALLRMNLLESNVLQGTTVASTVLEDGEEFRITLDYRDGRRMVQHFDDFKKLRSRLNELAADNSSAEHFTQVKVQMPAPALAGQKLRIIDTPGLNATVGWHEETTIRTLKETSDLSVILVDAVRPMPDSLVQFVQEHLRFILGQCAFVVTKMDLIPQKEWQMLLRYIKKVIQSRLNILDPLVLPYASLEVLALPGKENERTKENLLRSNSLESEKTLLAHVARQRQVAQTKKLISMTADLCENILLKLEQNKRYYHQQLAQMEQTRQASLQQFVQMQTVTCQREFEKDCVKIKNDLDQEAQVLVVRARQNINTLVSDQTSTDRLNEYIQKTLKRDCQKEAQAIALSICQKTNLAKYQEAYKEVIGGFQESFQKNFYFLPALPVLECSALVVIPSITVPNASEINLAGICAQETVKKENICFGGGAAAGAAVGTAVFPVVGTIIGGIMGMVAGSAVASASGADLQNMREKILEKLKLPLIRYFTEAAEEAVHAIDQQGMQLNLQIPRELERYQQVYQPTINKWIQQEQASKQRMEHLMAEIKADLQRLEARQNSLESVQAHLQTKESEDL